MRKILCVFRVFLWSESATTLRQDWTDTCVLEPCKNDASEREERKSPNPGKRSEKRSVRVYAANCDCVTRLSKAETAVLCSFEGGTLQIEQCCRYNFDFIADQRKIVFE